MNPLYARLRSTADRLIAAYGQPAVLVKPGGYTPGSNPEPLPPTEEAVTAVDMSKLERDTSGALTGRVQHKLLVSTTGGRPEKDDEIRIGGRSHQVVTVAPLEPGGLTLLYEVLIDG